MTGGSLDPGPMPRRESVRTDCDPASELRVGWCPGALRPMRAGDGLLVRIKPRGARLTFEQVRGIAALAARHGTGVITLTGKGNLQVRGVGEDALADLTAALDHLGLLDGSARGEAARNVLSNPLAGHDPAARADLRPAVAALEAWLSAGAAPSLPAKFAWSVDEDGLLPLSDDGADIGFVAAGDGPGAELEVTLADDTVAARCRPDVIVAVAGRLAAAFLVLCQEAGLVPHRMRDLVGRVGAAPVFARAGLAAGPRRLPAPAPAASVGLHHHGPASFVGAAPRFGLIEAAALAGFAAAAEAAGAPDLRLTSWRSLLAPGLTEPAATALWEALGALPLIRDPADPRLRVVACVGAPRCLRATTAVQDDAERLAATLAPSSAAPVLLHVSGCAKGCARGGPSPVTLVGRAEGYDLVRQGRADDPPARRGVSPGDLSLAELCSMVSGLEEAPG